MPDAGGVDPPVAAPAPLWRSTYQPADLSTDMVLADGLIGAESVKAVRAEDARRDLGALFRVLEQGYAGFEGLPGGRRAWERAFATLDGRLPADGAVVETRAFVALLVEVLAPLANDGALRLELVLHDEASVEVALAERTEAMLGDVAVEREGEVTRLHAVSAPSSDMALAPIMACGDVAALPETFPVWDAQVGGPVLRFGWLGPAPTALLCDVALDHGVQRKIAVRTGPVAMSRSEQPPADGVQVIHGEVPVVRVATFDALGARGVARLEAMIEPLVDSPVVVVDLRGTHGEGRETASWLAQAISPGMPGRPRVRTVRSGMTAQGQMNLAHQRIARFEAAFPPDQPGRDGALEHELQEAVGAARTRLQAQIGVGGEQPEWEEGGSAVVAAPSKVLKGQVVVLVDRGCRGLCEELAATVAPDERVVLVGENTAGETGFDEPLSYRLPYSLVWVYVPSRVWADGDGNVAAGTGVLPEIWVDDARPLDVALDIARHSVSRP